MELEYGRDIPRASMAVAIVLAVYMPPQAPGPGHDFCTISRRSCRRHGAARQRRIPPPHRPPRKRSL
jgi:hypothetical protein